MFRTKGALVFMTGAALLASGGLADATAVASTKHHHAGGTFVTGRLNAGGYTIVALGTNGKMTWSKARSFSLRAPASQYTLQLISANGRYAGPVVVGEGSHKVVVGLEGGVRLGTIDVVAGKGYARVAKRVRAGSLVSSRWAWAKHGVPIGNGRNLGLVKSPTKGTGPSGPGGDSDRSGIPNAFDIASNGNAVIDALAPSQARAFGAHIADAGNGGNGASSTWMSQMFLPIEQTVNDDAAGVSQAEIDSTLQANLNLKLLNLPAADELELDCNGLSFCSPGGTGEASEEGLPAPQGVYPEVPFPAASLDPSTGFGEVVGPNVPAGLLGTLTGNGAKEFSLFPNATSSRIGSGDVITEQTTTNGVTTQTPTTIEFVFNTVPAIASYDDGQGQSGTISYPDSSGVGTQNNPIRVAPGPGGDVRVTFSVYRPQRAGIAGAGEPAFMDIGHLWYAFDSVSAPAPGQTTVGAGQAPECPTADYSNPSSTLTDTDGSAGGGQFSSPPGTAMLVDSAADQPANPANTISFTVDVSACMAAKGQPFPVGRPVMFDISANSQSSADHSNQKFWLERTS
ncbi:MAG TPA: hypothetical protein VMA76_07640 [Solirubrobacteraceae bacterium]|nr:hypothetical protein [Solirubrobacteraceae bacterium]